MNNLPFGTANYRQFQNNFLASVLVGMVFSPSQDAETHKDQWSLFTQELFSVGPLEGLFQKPIVINRGDHKLSYVFDKTRALVQINDDGYQNFADTVIPHAYKLKRFITEVAGSDVISQLDIRKIDMFQIMSEDGKTVDENEIRKHFFSDSYLTHKEGLAQLNTEETHFQGMLKHQWRDENYVLTIRSAFIKMPGDSNGYRLILDTEEHYEPVGIIELNGLDKELIKMNKDLFNAFMWCISDRVVSIMEKGKE